MQIQGPESRSNALWLWLAGAGLVAGLTFLFLRFYAIPPAEASFEVGNFIGKPEIYSAQEKAWVPLQRGSRVAPRERIRTGEGAEVDLVIRDKLTVRVKGNSEVVNQSPGELWRLHLEQGSVLAATARGFEDAGRFEISTPVSVAAVRGTLFGVAHAVNAETTEVWVLQGKVDVSARKFFQTRNVNVGNLEKTVVGPDRQPSEPARISRDEWLQIKETYELIQRSAEQEMRQQDLSKKAGNLYGFVFDHGTFYMPKFGFSDREFVLDSDSGEVTLEINYDVFPRGSFAGMYMKIRDLDLSKYEALTFMVRRKPGEDHPESFRIEIKSRGQVLRAFKYNDMASEQFKKSWRQETFGFTANKATPVDEITFVFSHDQVGEFKKGALEFRNLNLVEKKEVPAPENPPADTMAAPQPAAAEPTEPAVS